MPVITINGVIGSGTLEIGHLVAQNLGLNYVDRYIFSEAARLVGSPVGQLIEKEQRVVPFRERVARFMQGVLERSAVAGAGAEPYFGRGIEMLPAEAYTELVSDAASSSPVHDRAFIDATTSVIKELAGGGDVVIIGRGSNMILADTPGVVHVGLVAPMDVRIDTMAKREMFSNDEARAYAEDSGKRPGDLLPQILPRQRQRPHELPPDAEHRPDFAKHCGRNHRARRRRHRSRY